jgi:dihydroorotase
MAILRIPALIDPHVHMVEMDAKGWQRVATLAMRAGYAALQIMPDLDPPIIDKLSLAHFSQITKTTAIPLYLTAAGTSKNVEELKQLRTVKAIKVWLGTGPEDLVVTKEEELRQILLSTEKVVMIHAEDELTLLKNFDQGNHELSIIRHGEIFNMTAAMRATVKAITAAKETGRKVYLSHISTGEEIELIRKAKEKGIRIYAEVAPHHLFLTSEDNERLGIFGKVNPPLRSKEDQDALWEAINDGTIDTIGSDTYNWSQEEKNQHYEEAPTGLPNLEVTLPLLITAVREKKLTLQKVIELTSINPAKIFGIPKPTRSLFIDVDTPRPYQPKLHNWHPYEFEKLVGWPIRQQENRDRTHK